MSEQLLKEIASTMKELLKWTRFAGMQQLRNILTQNLQTQIELLVYEASNGTRGAREVAQAAGLGSHTTVLSYWKKWAKVGIVEPSTKFEGRYQRICSLEEVGLTVPAVSQQTLSDDPSTKEGVMQSERQQ